jgi:hypothetical protein
MDVSTRDWGGPIDGRSKVELKTGLWMYDVSRAMTSVGRECNNANVRTIAALVCVCVRIADVF